MKCPKCKEEMEKVSLIKLADLKDGELFYHRCHECKIKTGFNQGAFVCCRGKPQDKHYKIVEVADE